MRMLRQRVQNESLVLGYIRPMVGLIAECFVSHRQPCRSPGLKAEVWKTFAEVTGFQLIFKQFDEIGFSNSADPAPNATFVLQAVKDGTVNASLALSAMQEHRFKVFRYSLPLYFSQNGLVAGKVAYGPPRPIPLQVFDWYSILLLAMFVLIIGIARGNVWTCFAEYLNKKSRRRTIGDSVLVLFGAILFIWFNAGMRSQAGAARKRTRLTGNELKLGLNKGTYRISTRDYISAEHANKLNLLNRRVNQADIDKIISYETNFEKIAQQLCEDERMIRFEWSGGVNTLIGGRWKSAKCILEKLDIYDSSELNTRVPSGFALNRDFPQVYRDLLNQIIIRQFYGNQLERAMRRYDLHPLTPGQKEGDLLPDPLSLHLLSHGFIFFVVASSLCVVAIIVELLTLTTIPFDTSNAYRVSTFRPDDLD